MNKLSPNFLFELFRLCFAKKSILEIVKEHLKYQYIDDDLKELKKILRSMIAYYDTQEKIPTFGYISQQYSSDVGVQELLHEIKKSDIPSDINQMIIQLEDYIKGIRFQLLYKQVKELYNSDKSEEAIELNAKESEEIVNFSITKGTSHFYKVFENFNETIKQKQVAKENGEFLQDKVPFGIKQLDELTYGGVDKTDTVCILAPSGVGKSTMLKYIGYYNARLGYDVMHVSLEGSREECIDKYNQIWTGQKYIDIKYGDLVLTEKEREKLDIAINRMVESGKDIYVYAAEMFDDMNCRQLRDLVVQYFKEKGKYPDLILVDSLDLIHPGDGNKYGIDTQSVKMRKENSARKMKNICAEFKTRLITVDQADNIPSEKREDPEFIITHHNAAQAKGLLQSFSYYLTLNQTKDEKKLGVMRIGIDKLRNYFTDLKFIRIATKYETGKFYDAKKTKEINEKYDQIGEVKNAKHKSVKSKG